MIQSETRLTIRTYATKAVALILFALLPVAALAQACGGTERWQVKVGTDTGANTVDVDHPVVLSLANTLALPTPTMPGGNDNDTRTTSERSVYVVQGRLLKFKLESGRTGDRDYHLVITDDTLQFAPAGHSLVAEIPDPNCVAGKQGDPEVASRFEEKLAAVRAAFEARFPHITGGWNEVGGIPVKVTGVGFFDRSHGQTGRAPNNLELHPVLDISFDEDAHTDVDIPVTSTLLQNSGFEAGSAPWTATAGVITTDPGEPAHTGSGRAWLGGYGELHTDTLVQTVTIPATATSAMLRFFLHISTDEEQLQAFDTLKVQVRGSTGPTGSLLKTLATYSNKQAAPGFGVETFDLTAFRGQTVRIHFVATEDAAKMTSFVLDDITLVIQ